MSTFDPETLAVSLSQARSVPLPMARLIVQHALVANQSVLKFMAPYHVTAKGQLAKRAEAMLATFAQRGGRWKILVADDTAVRVEFTSPSAEPYVCEVRLADFEARGVTKGKETWRQFPGAMLWARCVSTGLRRVDPESTDHLYAPEDYDEIGGTGTGDHPAEPEVRPSTGAGLVGLVEKASAPMVQPTAPTNPLVPVTAPVEPTPPAQPVAPAVQFPPTPTPTPASVAQPVAPAMPDYTLYALCPLPSALGKPWDDCKPAARVKIYRASQTSTDQAASQDERKLVALVAKHLQPGHVAALVASLKRCWEVCPVNTYGEKPVLFEPWANLPTVALEGIARMAHPDLHANHRALLNAAIVAKGGDVPEIGVCEEVKA